MRKNLITFLLFTISVILSATVWRVNNNAGIDTDFITLQEAHNGAASGDELHVTGSTTSYGDITLTKELTIIGTGYFLSENPETQANENNSIADVVVFDSGSEGSVVAGFKMYYANINADSITIKRCRIHSIGTYYDGINVNGANDVYILQNYIYATGYNSDGIEVSNNSNNVLISNNLIKHTDSSRRSIYTTSSSGANISNNCLYGKVDIHNSEFYNNILQYGYFYDNASTNFYYNIGNSDQFEPCDENGNQCNIDMNDVFVGTGSTDGKYQLKEVSPAIGAGVTGEDCGAFDGIYPYILSGIPSEIPAIYDFFSPGAGFEISVEIKAKSHE